MAHCIIDIYDHSLVLRICWILLVSAVKVKSSSGADNARMQAGKHAAVLTDWVTGWLASF